MKHSFKYIPYVPPRSKIAAEVPKTEMVNNFLLCSESLGGSPKKLSSLITLTVIPRSPTKPRPLSSKGTRANKAGSRKARNGENMPSPVLSQVQATQPIDHLDPIIQQWLNHEELAKLCAPNPVMIFTTNSKKQLDREQLSNTIGKITNTSKLKL